jgi:dolichol-phosphate mannosyltransferase
LKISLLIPFYNEEEQIPLTIEAVVPIMMSVGHDFEILMIDDGSRDNTWAVIESACRQDARLAGLRLSRNFGKEAAICAALDRAEGDAVILMDGDLQHPPRHIPEMISLWQQGYAIVEGVKSSRGRESLASKLNASIFYGMFRRFTGIDLRNASDFKLLDRSVVMQWRQLGEHDTFFRGLSAWMGFKRTTFSFDVASRQAGSSKWSPLKLIALSLNAITGFTAVPLHFITLLGLVMLFGSFILAIQTLVNFFTGHADTGFTTVILLLLLIGGSIMISLGLIGIYIARIFTEVKGRPRYIIAQDTRQKTYDLPDDTEAP